MTDEQQEAPAAGGDDAVDLAELMEDGGNEAGDPDAAGVISAEELLEDPGPPQGRAPEEIATGEARAKAAADAGAAAATGQPPPPQESADAEAEAGGSAVSDTEASRTDT